MEAKPEVLALVESWLREACPETLDQKGIHIIAKLCELSVWTYREMGTAQCHPGRAFLSKLTGWNVTKVSRFTSKLRDWGLLRKYQPRSFNHTTQQWDPSTTIYRLAFLGHQRVRQLAAILKIDLTHMKASPKQEKQRPESCVNRPMRNPVRVVGNIAKQVYARVMVMAKRVEEQVETPINTGNVARDVLLNRFAKLGQCHVP